MKKILLLLAVVGMMISCGGKKDFSNIEKGMTIKEVKKLVGEPTEEVDVVGTLWLFYEKEGVLVVTDGEKVMNVVNKEEMEKKGKMLEESFEELDFKIEE
ncbi:hypothetical protein LJC11_04185 [Bacteroidales bacterium OttesenSCG-928-I21]|nr:hypothetical protein [Bacteroidales bacterium OttesenSCG-928-I21]